MVSTWAVATEVDATWQPDEADEADEAGSAGGGAGGDAEE